MEEKIRVIQNGVGVVGSRFVRQMVKQPRLQLVGAIDTAKEKVGRDLGEVAGVGKNLSVTVSDDPDAVFSETVADIVIDATFSYTRELYPIIVKALKAKLNFISVAEELSYPWLHEPELATSLDRLAKKNGVSVLGTGGNPGWCFDLLPVFLSGARMNVRKIWGRRVTDARSLAGSTIIRAHQGIGLTLEEFREGEEKGQIAYHIGGPESATLLAEALGWKVEIKETKEPLIAKVRRDFSPHLIIEPGQVFGTRNTVHAFRDVEEVMTMEMNVGWGWDPETDGLDNGFSLRVEGDSAIEVAITGITAPNVVGDLLESRVIHAIPWVVNARPGILKVTEQAALMLI